MDCRSVKQIQSPREQQPLPGSNAQESRRFFRGWLPSPRFHFPLPLRSMLSDRSARVRVQQRNLSRRFVADKGTAALTAHDESLVCQDFQCPADRDPRGAKMFAELTFRRQPLACPEL